MTSTSLKRTRVLLLSALTVFATTAMAATAPVKAGAKTPFDEVNQLCQADSRSLKDIRTNLSKTTIPSSASRMALVNGLQKNQLPRCREALVDFFKMLKDKPAEVVAENGKRSFVTVGVAAGIEEAFAALEAEMERDSDEDWLEILRAEAPSSYTRGMKKFISIVASQIRYAQSMPKNAPEAYGAATTDSKERTPVRPTSPLIVERYLTEINASKRNLTLDELSELNAIFAGSTQSYRQVFLSPLRNVLSRQSVDWIASFRKEPVWSQVRLFPLMSSLGGPEVARELMWLSTQHKDFRVRAMANKALDDLAEERSNEAVEIIR